MRKHTFGDAELREVGASRERGQRERQHPGVHVLAQRRRLVDGGILMLGMHAQLVGDPRGLVARARQRARTGDVGLEQLVDEVDVRKDGVGVGAVEQDVLEELERNVLGGRQTLAFHRAIRGSGKFGGRSDGIVGFG